MTTLKKEGKPQKTRLKNLVVRKVTYGSMIMISWLEGKSVVEKLAQATGTTTALRGLLRVNLRTWERFTISRLILVPNIKVLLNQRCQKVSYLGYGEKELGCCSMIQSLLFDIKVNFHWIWKSRSWSLEEEEAHNPRYLKSNVKFLQSDDLGCPFHLLVLVVGPLCFYQIQSQRF